MREIKDEVIHQKEHAPKEEAPPKEVEPPKASDKTFYWAVGIVIGIIVLFIAGNMIAARMTPQPRTLDELHIDTLAGEESEVQFVYNGYSFVRWNDLWWFQWQKDNNLFDVSLRFSPRETESVAISGFLNDSFNQPNVYITFDPTVEVQKYNALAAAEIALNLNRALGLEPIPACTQAHPDCFGRPIVTCENRSLSIIHVDEGQGKGTAITLDGNCIVMQGAELEILRSVDRILYQWYKVIE